jgi:hypothetical protein
MFSLLIFMAVIGAVDVLALRYGVDSRRDDGRKLWLETPTRRRRDPLPAGYGGAPWRSR